MKMARTMDQHPTDERAPASAPGVVRMGSVLASIERDRGLVQKNLVVDGRRTSVRLEPSMWIALYEIAAREGQTVSEVVTAVAQRKPAGASFTSAIRVFVLNYYKLSTH